MTREAALLGLNVYTIFGGKLGAADEFLINTGRLIPLRSPSDLDRVVFQKRSADVLVPADQKRLDIHITEQIMTFAEERVQCPTGVARMAVDRAR